MQRLECELSAGGGTLTHRHWRHIWDRLHRGGHATATDYHHSARPPSTQPATVSAQAL